MSPPNRLHKYGYTTQEAAKEEGYRLLKAYTTALFAGGLEATAKPIHISERYVDPRYNHTLTQVSQTVFEATLNWDGHYMSVRWQAIEILC